MATFDLVIHGRVVMLPKKFDTTLALKAISLTDRLNGTEKRIAAALLECLVSAPEEVRVGLVRLLMAEPQCLICGDFLT